MFITEICCEKIGYYLYIECDPNYNIRNQRYVTEHTYMVEDHYERKTRFSV